MTQQSLQDLSWADAAAVRLKTKTAWSQAGRSLRPDAEPAAYLFAPTPVPENN